jgi:hypothetical protein
MTIDQAITEQLNKISALPFGPQTRQEAGERSKELRGAFRAHCLSPERVQSTGEAVLRKCREKNFFPLPVDIELAAEEVAQRAAIRDWQQPDLVDCECRGTGFISTVHDGARFARPCPKCRKTVSA